MFALREKCRSRRVGRFKRRGVFLPDSPRRGEAAIRVGAGPVDVVATRVAAAAIGRRRENSNDFSRFWPSRAKMALLTDLVQVKAKTRIGRLVVEEWLAKTWNGLPRNGLPRCTSIARQLDRLDALQARISASRSKACLVSRSRGACSKRYCGDGRQRRADIDDTPSAKWY